MTLSTVGLGDDILLGQAGNDILISGGGNDVLDGGEGDDRAQFLGPYSHYEIRPHRLNGGCYYTVRTRKDVRDAKVVESATLHNIEAISFSNINTIRLDCETDSSQGPLPVDDVFELDSDSVTPIPGDPIRYLIRAADLVANDIESAAGCDQIWPV